MMPIFSVALSWAVHSAELLSRPCVLFRNVTQPDTVPVFLIADRARNNRLLFCILPRFA